MRKAISIKRNVRFFDCRKHNTHRLSGEVVVWSAMLFIDTQRFAGKKQQQQEIRGGARRDATVTNVSASGSC